MREIRYGGRASASAALSHSHLGRRRARRPPTVGFLLHRGAIPLVVMLTALLPIPTKAMDVVSARNGPWSSASTWAGGLVPGNGDTVAIRANHDVTVDAKTAIGHSPQAGDARPAVAVNDSASLTVASGVTLTVRGDLKLHNATLALRPGSALLFDASSAGNPSTARYVLQIGTAHSQSSKLICIGTTERRASIRSGGGANARLTDGGFIAGGQVEALFCDFTGIGDRSHAGFAFWPGHATFRIQNSVIDGGGQLAFSTTPEADVVFQLLNVTFKNTAASEVMNISFYGSRIKDRGSRIIDGCVFDKTMTLQAPNDLTLINTYFHDAFTVTDGQWARFSGNLVRKGSEGMNLAGSVTDSYILFDTASDNPHGIGGPPDPGGGITYDSSLTINGSIFQYTGQADNGDMVLGAGPDPPAP